MTTSHESERLNELYAQQRNIQDEIDAIKRREVEEETFANKKYINKCYKRKPFKKSNINIFGSNYYTYFKVVSERASSPRRVTVLKVPEFPLYYFEYKISLVHSIENYFCGGFENDFIELTDIMVSDLEVNPYYEEVTLEEFNQNLTNFFTVLKDMKFIADHNRQGSCTPLDEEWSNHESMYKYVKERGIVDEKSQNPEVITLP